MKVVVYNVYHNNGQNPVTKTKYHRYVAIGTLFQTATNSLFIIPSLISG